MKHASTTIHANHHPPSSSQSIKQEHCSSLGLCKESSFHLQGPGQHMRIGGPELRCASAHADRVNVYALVPMQLTDVLMAIGAHSPNDQGRQLRQLVYIESAAHSAHLHMLR